MKKGPKKGLSLGGPKPFSGGEGGTTQGLGGGSNTRAGGALAPLVYMLKEALLLGDTIKPYSCFSLVLVRSLCNQQPSHCAGVGSWIHCHG